MTARAEPPLRQHLCLCYQSHREQIEGILSFIRQGLAAGEQCLYIPEDRMSSAVLRALDADVANADGAPSSGALTVLSRDETYLLQGVFDPDRMLALVQARAGSASAAGFSGFRLVSDLAGMDGSVPGGDRLVEYEARLNETVAVGTLSVLCVYDAGRLPRGGTLTTVETHPVVMVDGTICANPFFAAPDRFLRRDWPAQEGRWLLDNLRALQLADSRRSQADEKHRELWLRLFERQELERRSFARDLHDDLGQALTALHLGFQALRLPAATAPEASASLGPAAVVAHSDAPPRVRAFNDDDSARDVAAFLPDIHTLLSDTMESVRSLALDLRPPVLDDFGLAAALRSQARRFARRGGLHLDLDVDAVEGTPVPQVVETACFRVVLAALTNVVQHSRATRVRVQAGVNDRLLEVMVQDDGTGFDVRAARERAEAGASIGIIGMEERAYLVGGALEIDSAPGKATVIRARFPLDREVPG